MCQGIVLKLESGKFPSQRTFGLPEIARARKLLEAGFEYICSHKDIMLFRKRK
jgi:hypothetical protein